MQHNGKIAVGRNCADLTYSHFLFGRSLILDSKIRSAILAGWYICGLTFAKWFSFPPMKRSISALAIILGFPSVAWAAEPSVLTTLHAVHALSKADAQKGLPVAFEATV